jgi:hypothetical protein
MWIHLSNPWIHFESLIPNTDLKKFVVICGPQIQT